MDPEYEKKLQDDFNASLLKSSNMVETANTWVKEKTNGRGS